MPNVKVGPKHQITIPNEVFKQLNLTAGDFLEMAVEVDRIVLTPQKLIPSDQAWFWTKNWQKRILGGKKDVVEGRLSGPFEDADDLLAHLNADEDSDD